MFRRILLTALLAGVGAGFVASTFQFVAVVPLIQEAETYERGDTPAVASPANHDAPAPAQAHGHDHANGQAAADHHAQGGEWEPKDGLERNLLTVIANLLTGIGFALALVGAFAASGREIGWKRGLAWGLAGFAAFALAPALGLPPTPPGVAGGDLLDRQLWWAFAAFGAAGGIALMVFGGKPFWRVLGVLPILLPHLVGAPSSEGPGLAPPELVRQFAVASLLGALCFWLALGALAGAIYRRAPTP